MRAHDSDVPTTARGRRAPKSRADNLGEYVQALFVHAPKALGSRFSRPVVHQVAEGKVLSAGRGDLFPALASASRYRVVEGNLPLAVEAVLQEPLLVMAFLRRPVDRTLAALPRRNGKASGRTKRSKGSATPTSAELDVIRTHANRQTALLGADFEFAPLLERFESGELSDTEARAELRALVGDPDHETLARAKRRLEQIHFLGLAEAADESRRLLGDLLGFMVDPGAERRVGTRPLSAHYDAATVEAIADVNVLDQELYEFAVDLFDRRYNDRFGETPKMSEPGDASTSSAGASPKSVSSGNPRQQLRQARQENDALRREIHAMNADAAARLRGIDRIQREASATRLELEMMRSSRTWRLTRPLRAIANGLRRLLGRRDHPGQHA